jgi:predicted metal-dependent hydrolase
MSNSEIISTAVGQCSLRRSERRTLEISVLPDGAVELVAPSNAPVESILQKVEKRARWIHKKVRAFKQMNAGRSKVRYFSGATHRYLGRQYRLKVSTGDLAAVKLIGGYFQIATRTGAEEEVERLLSAWFRERARDQFSKRLDGWGEWCRKQKLPEPTLHLRLMPKRWGSAQKDGKIYLNPELIRTPSICIDYVITHEICHLRHRDHDRAFYQLLGRLFPGWKEVKHRLERAEL